jgi:lipopolysaccharide export system permease protein
MIKTLEKYLIWLFLKKIFIISLIFLTLIFTLTIFEEISFLKNVDSRFFLPFLMTLLTSPSVLFEIFPFIFLLATQFFFLELINKKELEAIKLNGLNNLKLIRVLFFSSFLLGLLLLAFYYNFSAKLKFVYLDIKNNYSTDNKYLAVVTENGLWIKDESEKLIYIVSAEKIELDDLKNVVISIFDKKFDLVKIIQSPKVNIYDYKWIIYNPLVSIGNQTTQMSENIYIDTHFNREKINSLFSNLTALNIFELINLKNDYKELGYSTNEVDLHLHKLFSLPFYLSIMTVFSSLIMLNIKRNRSLIFHIILGVLLSVFIYYLYYLFNLFGENGKIPFLITVWLPLLVLLIFILIGMVKINEK